MTFDTIAAIATGTGRTAIGILRVSGPGAIPAVEAVFRPAYGKSPFSCRADRTLVYGTLYDSQGRAIDQCLATLSHGPNSYTGEDTCELQCHGSPAVLAAGLEALFAQGVRQARAGEFTKRAFLNGRMDLTQAEAVIDLIDAQSAAAARNAAGQLSGSIRRRIDGIYDRLVEVSAHFDVVLDYGDEDLEPFEITELERVLDTCIDQLDALLSTVQRGRQLREGVPCAIVGAANAGKSSLLNLILGYDRAIVTEIPGTTRDTLQETATLGGVLLRLTDTAGLRETTDRVERLGVERSRQTLEQAELVLAVVDGAKPLDADDWNVLALAEQAEQVICIVNKSDLGIIVDIEALKARFPGTVVLSAATGAGLKELEQAVAACFPSGAGEGSGELLTNLRQADAAAQARAALARAREGLQRGVTPDMLLTDTEEALHALGEITGRAVAEDVTARIFSRFCVGK
ncbi:MAG: tRNA uridine-5-carboxymethylaminomethyl(34) synthesis GTPase MnmE [Oscillospiraceae bacterium]|nr:tRNA uridine-5-carboxymethylaminomethyl(34) synthesis GTPase MnmE [Oscillospiraceae bacterium]